MNPLETEVNNLLMTTTNYLAQVRGIELEKGLQGDRDAARARMDESFSQIDARLPLLTQSPLHTHFAERYKALRAQAGYIDSAGQFPALMEASGLVGPVVRQGKVKSHI